MNHLGDTNKMVETPRTDAHIDGLRRDPEVSGCDRTLNFCRQLERELNEANDRIKRLEEAVEAYRTAYTPDGHVSPHDCFATGPKTGNPFQDLFACPGCLAERKAKEAKP